MCEHVLVVDDHEPWQRLISASLRKDRRWQVVETASDGLEAIRKAETLRPGLILMDVELPELDGVEAAKRILAKQPDALLLFVSGHRSADIVEAAMGTGARGYVVKAEAGRDLPFAIERAMHGSRYLSPMLYGRALEPRRDRLSHHHEAGFYANDAGLVEAYAEFTAKRLRAGEFVVVIATAAHLAGVRQRLLKKGLDVDREGDQRRYLPMNVDAVLGSFMVDGSPDETLFWKAATSWVMRTAAETPERPVRIAACGECAGVLIEKGQVEEAIQVEHWCSEMVAAFDLEVFCGYCTSAAHAGNPGVLHRIEQEHTAICSG